MKEWLKKNWEFILIFAIAFIYRFYYFWITKAQPLWFDEAGYMASAKSYAGIGFYQLENIRLPGFPILMSLFFKIGLYSEPIIRFFSLFIPSLIVISLVYFCVKEMYKDKKIAIISATLMIFLWEHVFYSNRFHTENFSLIFQFLSILILFKCYINKENLSFITPKYSLLWIFISFFLAVMFRPGTLMFLPVIFLFVLYLNKDQILTKKGIILSCFSLFVLLFLFLFLSKYSGLSTYFNLDEKLAWNSLNVFKGFLSPTDSFLPFSLIILFIIGFVQATLLFFKKVDDYQAHIFNLLTIFIVLFEFIFIIRSWQSFEYRWFFPMIIAIFSFAGLGLISLLNQVDFLKSNKGTAIALIGIIILSYPTIIFTHNLINQKLASYQEVKDSGIWLKEHTSPNDFIVSASVTQHAYYSERKIIDFYTNGTHNETLFIEKLNTLKPKYVVISVFEPVFTPSWAYNLPRVYNKTFIPAKAYWEDEWGQQPLLVIFEIKGEVKNG